MTNEAIELMSLFAKWYAKSWSAKSIADYKKRDLVCTPFAGNYGTTAGWVICVNGSPPKGTLLVFDSGPPNSPAFYIHSTSRRISSEQQSAIIKSFWKKHLKDVNDPVVIKMTEAGNA